MTLLLFNNASTDNTIGARGATSLSESLKVNTTLVEIDLSGKKQRKKTHKRHPSTIHSFPFIITSTGNKVGDTGVASLSEALKSNTTLTELNLSGQDKRKQIHKRRPSTNYLLHADIIDRQQD